MPVTFVIVNNRSYRVLKERMPPGAAYTGMDLRDPAIDFVALAQSLGLNARRVTEPRDIEETLRAGFSSGAPNLVEVQVDDGFGN